MQIVKQDIRCLVQAQEIIAQPMGIVLGILVTSKPFRKGRPGMAKKKQMIKPQIRRFKLKDLRPADYNPRTITDEAMEGLSASIKKFGCVEPIVVNVRGGKNTIIGGHQRFRILKKLRGDSHGCLCVTVDLDKKNEKLLNLSLNNPHIQGEFIMDLGNYIDRLKAMLPSDKDYLALKIEKLRSEVEKINFEPLDDEIRLDQLEPLMVKCPKCGHKFNARKQV